MKMILRTRQEGKHTKVGVFVEGQKSGELVFLEDEYEPFLLAIVGGAALLKEGECNRRLEVEVDDRRRPNELA